MCISNPVQPTKQKTFSLGIEEICLQKRNTEQEDIVSFSPHFIDEILVDKAKKQVGMNLHAWNLAVLRNPFHVAQTGGRGGHKDNFIPEKRGRDSAPTHIVK